jgi:zinc protease
MNARSYFFITLAIVVNLLAHAPRALAQAEDWKQIVIPPLREFHPQQPHRVALPNGMVILLQEDHELPLVNGTALIRGGSREVPADKVGLADLYGQAWRTGGTKAKTGDELDDYLEARAAKVETGGGIDSTSVSWSCLKGDFDDVFKVFVEVLREPAFREEKIDLAKRQINTAISRRNDDSAGIAQREARKLAYGADSPYARVPEYATVASVTRDDLLNWHRTYLAPNNIILGVAGDFDSNAMEAKLREAFASWPKGPATDKTQTALQQPKPGIYFVQKDDVNQSTIRMVDLGTTKDNPDYYAIEVLNEVFGGSFASRLFSNIRTKKGLAYYVFGTIGTGFDHPGVLQLGVGTKSGTTAAAIEALFEELDNLEKNPATPEELKKADDSILNSFIFRFDSKRKILRERMAYEFYGYPPDFLERYRQGIEKVTQTDVARVARRYFHKDRLAILVVGKAADFDRPLSSFGTVTTLDISIPAGPGSTSEAPVASNPEGKALLAKVIEGLGGEERVRAIKSVRQKVTVLANTPQGEMPIDAEQVAVLPDRLWQKLMTPMGEMTMVLSPTAAYMTAPMGTRDMPASQEQEALSELKREPFFVAQHADDPDFAFSSAGSEKIGDVETRILDVNADGTQVRWFVDPQSGRILRATSQSMGPGGPGERVVDYSDWKTVEGLSIPFKEVRTRGGQRESTVEVKEVEFNPSVDMKLFDKPAEETPGNSG